jgi:hypothetical protein
MTSKNLDQLFKLDATFIICLTLVLLSSVVGLGYYYVTDRTLMASNIDSAIAKGIDPLSVRCSYAKSDDLICIAFAASAQSHNVATIAKK